MTVVAVSSLAMEVTLVPEGTVWKYNDTGANLGTAWKEPAYNDGSWASGPAELGYGDGDEATVVSYGPDANNKYVTTYFRHAFQVANAASIVGLTLEVLRDDGAVVYLNGTQVASYSMPSTFDYRTYANTATDYAWDPPISLPVNLLVNGVNVLAVEIHQCNATSSDINLDIRLIGDEFLPGVAPNAPVLLTPQNGASGVTIPPNLQAQVSDPDNDLLTVTFYGRKNIPAEPFTLVVLPDTQKYVASSTYAPIFTQQTQWIVNNRSALNIVTVTHEGDIVDTYNSVDQWNRANTSLTVLDNSGLPYGLSPGNHDQPTTYYNQHFPPTRYAGKPWYGGNYPVGKNDNSYILFSAAGIDFLLVQLNFWPKSDEIAWADGVLKAFPNRKAIITTHGFLGLDTSRTVHVMGSTEYIWTGLVLPNPNVWFVLCGHVHGEARRTDYANGHPVHQILADYQTAANGGNGWLRIMRFAPVENSVHISTYSPYLNQFQTDADSEFTLEFPIGGFDILAMQSGVSSGAAVAHSWSEALPNVAYQWLVTATDPTGRTTQSPVRTFTTGLTDTAPPLITGVNVSQVTDHSAVVTWTTDEPADSVVRYRISGGAELEVGSPALVTEHNVAITSLGANTTYYFVVSCSDVGGNTASSTEGSFTTSAGTAHTAPSGLSATPYSDTEIALAWNDNSSDETGFQVERSTDGLNWSTVGTVAAGTTGVVDTGLTSGTMYYYRALACIGTTCSAPSPVAAAAPFVYSSATSETMVTGTLIGTYANTWQDDSIYERLTEKLVGGKPANRYSSLEHRWTFLVTPGQSVILFVQAYEPASGDGDKFVLEYSADGVTYQGTLQITATTDTGAYQSLSLPPTLQGTIYVRVRDTDQTVGKTALDSLYVDHLLIRTDVSPVTAPPLAPTLRNATAGNQTITLAWNPSTGATSYTVWRRSGGGNYSRVAQGITQTTFVDVNLVNGITYEYVVTAVNGYGESANSNAMSATPSAPTVPAAPTNLTATAAKRKISLNWTQSATSGITQNRVYRSNTGVAGTFALLTTIAANTTYSDSAPTGTTYYYVVTAISVNGESAASNPAFATAK